MEQNSSKAKCSRTEFTEPESSKIEETKMDSAGQTEESKETPTNSSANSNPKRISSVFHQPPGKRPRRSFSPVHASSKSKKHPTCSSTAMRRGQNRSQTPPLKINVPNLSRHSVQGQGHTSSAADSTSGGSTSFIGPGPLTSPPVGSTSPRGAGGTSLQVRRTGTSNLEGAGVGILRDGAGWPGFGSEEEMGMSSSGAEEDERNNKYTGFEWEWDDNDKSSACCLAKQKTEVRFHLDYSCGTAAARGSETMRDGQFYWEVKMVSPVYGTDMMIGVGTKQLDLNKYSRAFCSMLGHDNGSESCGLSYTGRFQKAGVGRMYCSKFGQGAVIGMHLDMWSGTLTYYKNGKYLGIATRNLMNKTWYPIVSSTAARSSMRLVNTKSFPSNLQFWCCQALRRAVPPELSVLEVLALPPGLKNFLEDNLSWLLRAQDTKSEVECKTKGTQTVLSMISARSTRQSALVEADQS